MLNMTQIIGHWFYMLDMNNQTFQRKFPGISAFPSFLYHLLREGMLVVRAIFVFVCGVFIWQPDMNKNQKKPSGETDGFLTWAILYDSIEARENRWTNSSLYIELSAVYLPMLSHSPVEPEAAGYVTLIVDRHGTPSTCRNYASHFKKEENISHERLCTINSVHTFHMNTHIMGPPVVWPEGGVCCVACQTWWYFLWRSDLISRVLWRAESQTTWPWPMTVTWKGGWFLMHGCD